MLQDIDIHSYNYTDKSRSYIWKNKIYYCIFSKVECDDWWEKEQLIKGIKDNPEYSGDSSCNDYIRIWATIWKMDKDKVTLTSLNVGFNYYRYNRSKRNECDDIDKHHFLIMPFHYHSILSDRCPQQFLFIISDVTCYEQKGLKLYLQLANQKFNG